MLAPGSLGFDGLLERGRIVTDLRQRFRQSSLGFSGEWMT